MGNFNTTNAAPQNPPEKAADRSQTPTRSGSGAIIGAFIIILILAAGAFYFWGAKLNSSDGNPPPLILGDNTATTDIGGTPADGAIASIPSSDPASGLPTQQTSDDTDAINADINAMNINQLGAQTDNSLQTYGTATQ